MNIAELIFQIKNIKSNGGTTSSRRIMAKCATYSLFCHGGSNCCGMVSLSSFLTALKDTHACIWPLTTLLFLYWGLHVAHPVSHWNQYRRDRISGGITRWEQVWPLQGARGRTHRRVVYAMLFTKSPHSPLSWCPFLSLNSFSLNTPPAINSRCVCCCFNRQQ